MRGKWRLLAGVQQPVVCAACIVLPPAHGETVSAPAIEKDCTLVSIDTIG
jgi:hypothetical protein